MPYFGLSQGAPKTRREPGAILSERAVERLDCFLDVCHKGAFSQNNFVTETFFYDRQPDLGVKLGAFVRLSVSPATGKKWRNGGVMVGTSMAALNCFGRRRGLAKWSSAISRRFSGISTFGVPNTGLTKNSLLSIKKNLRINIALLKTVA